MALNRATSGLAIRATKHLEALGFAELPLFLCPALARRSTSLWSSESRPTIKPLFRPFKPQTRCLHSAPQPSEEFSLQAPNQSLIRLPQNCAGCGAASQTIFKDEPGFFTLTRRSIKTYLGILDGPQNGRRRSTPEEDAGGASSVGADEELLKSLGLESHPPTSQSGTIPVCDRCHKLLHHHSGVSIHHPSIQSIQDTIAESPHKYNHVYHIIDAADFPMSLIPKLSRLLDISPMRTLNRRSKSGKYVHDKKTEVSFVITRSDLLAPLKTQVDSLMPYLTSVLRDALGSFGQSVRLGNVRCVSAKRAWWTKELKEEIWKRGGGGWMLGKVNVGKSQLFESVFPKGRQNGVTSAVSSDLRKLKSLGDIDTVSNDLPPEQENETAAEKGIFETPTTARNTWSLLPPAPAETNYPQMPLVSSLPGTTASPIRVPFGNGKGELIDLPGLSRGDIELHVQEAHRSSLVMKSRVVPEQQVIKPGQSLLIGGFIRITPTTPDVIVLGYAFTPISAHLTSTEKAVAIQTQSRETGVENIANPGVGEKIASAGRFQLKWDVTKKRTGPITERSAAGIKVERLPYQVLSIDILIEGCGWVELVAQVRKRTLGIGMQQQRFDASRQEDEQMTAEPQWPEVEVFSPEGKFIGSRRPMSAWVLGGPKKGGARLKSRPRQSMKGEKKRAKVMRRLAEGQSG